MKTKSIGIFDSGLGGLTVMKAIKKLLPHEDIIYFGDTKNLPYGEKDKDTIIRYSLDNIDFLLTFPIKLIVIACHTVCTTAYAELQNRYDVPIIGMIEPSLELLQQDKQAKAITVLGTPATIRSGLYQKKILEKVENSSVTGLACPSFVPLIEGGYTKHPIAKVTIHNELKEIAKQKTDTVLLACTHYPLIQDYIQEEFSPHTTVMDPAVACALHTQKWLLQNDLLHPQKNPPNYTFFVSGNPETFSSLGESFLQHPILSVSSTSSPTR